jgi:hypothetical protein
MKHYLLLFLIPLLFSCQTKETKKEAKQIIKREDTIVVKPQVQLTQMPGKYNEKEDIWENSDPTYDEYMSFDKDNYAGFNILDKEGNSLAMGLIDKKGKVIIQPVYSYVMGGFVNGMCEVEDKNNKKGMVNEQGVEIVKPQYDSMDINTTDIPVDKNLLRVTNNEKTGFIDSKNGKVIIPVIYEGIDLVGEGLVMFMHEPQKWGIMNYKSKIIVEPIFTSINIFKNGKTSLQKADGEDYTVYADGRIVKE